MQQQKASATSESITREGLYSYERPRLPHVSVAGKKQTTLSFSKRTAAAAGMKASESQAKKAKGTSDAKARDLAWFVAHCWEPRIPHRPIA